MTCCQGSHFAVHVSDTQHIRFSKSDRKLYTVDWSTVADMLITVFENEASMPPEQVIRDTPQTAHCHSASIQVHSLTQE